MVLVFDTDPGVDDMMALMLLLAHSQDELRLISLTFGNCTLAATLRNVLSLFSVLEREDMRRKSQGLVPILKPGFRPTIALGSDGPLAADRPVNAEDVHGSDGLSGIHTMAPEFDCPSEWLEFFESDEVPSAEKLEQLPFQVERKKSWEAILDILRTEPEDTVTIIAVGPLTNCARAAKSDPKTFSRVKQILSMGAALNHPGNITPTAEFNVYADPHASALVYSLTASNPRDTYWDPPLVPKPLVLKIFPLDLTESQGLEKHTVEKTLAETNGSVLLDWTRKWLTQSFINYGKLVGMGPGNASIQLHDPLTVGYFLQFQKEWLEHSEDVRVETSGDWCVGMTIIDNRGRPRQSLEIEENLSLADNLRNVDTYRHRIRSQPHWLSKGRGNRVIVVDQAPYGPGFKETFDQVVLDAILNLSGRS